MAEPIEIRRGRRWFRVAADGSYVASRRYWRGKDTGCWSVFWRKGQREPGPTARELLADAKRLQREQSLPS